MGYKIDYEKNIEMNLKSNAVIQECMNSLDRAEEILNRIKETDSVKCKAKNSLNAYIGDVIISKMISTAKEAIEWLMLEQACYVYEMYDHDDYEKSIIEEECLDGIINGLTEHIGITEENLAGCKAAADAVADIMTLYPKAPDDMENAYAGLKEKAEETRETYREYLTKFEARAGNLEEYINECHNMVSQCANAEINMEEYVPGCGDALWAHETDSARIRLVTNIGYTEEELEKVSEKSEEIITAYIRRKEGEAKILRLGGVVLGGLSFICPFALSYTMPAIVASCTISSICVVYNMDEVYQGVQLLKASETRDTDAEIDRLVDFHNEALNKGYAILGELSTAYCGTLVMGTFIGKISGGKTLSFKSAIIETGEDVMTDQIAGCIDETLGGAHPVKRTVINFVIGGGVNAAKNKISAGNVTNNPGAIDTTDAKNVLKDIDATDAKNVIKGIDTTDAKNVVKDIDATDAKNVIKDIDATDVKNVVRDVDEIDVTGGKYSLLGEMTEADGKKYERFLKEGPQEGFTQAEIIGIYKADKQTALNTKSKRVVAVKSAEGGNPSNSIYIPRDADGNPIPLRKQRVNGQDITLPDPDAQGRPHTVLGSKISSKTGEIYLQSATFPGGTYPPANGYDVPWSEVHWTDHGKPHYHTSPHQHIFEYNPDKGGWIRTEPTPYYLKGE